MAVTSRTALFGRERELNVLEEMFDRVDVEGAALIVRGAPGVGKSALLQGAARRAEGRGMTVLKTHAIPSETFLPFAGLHQLLHPVIDRADGLPANQRDAIMAAFGETAAGVPDAFIIALAALHLLGRVAAEKPTLLIVEDVHWLDGASSNVLSFVARRLDSDPLVLLASTRSQSSSTFEDAELPELLLEPLDAEAAGAVADACSPQLSPSMRDRLLVEAEGNPLALLELPIAWSRLPEGTLLHAWVPLTLRLEQTFAARFDDMPPTTQTLLRIATLNDGDSVSEALAAASIVAGSDLTLDDLAPAVTEQLVETDQRSLCFRHSLVRSAIHQKATIAERYAGHAALAEVTHDDPDRNAWHRSASVVAPQEDVARDLDATAARAQRRGAIVVAITALERAAQLSGDAAGRGGRLLRAGELAAELGRPDVVGRLLDEAESLELEPLDRERIAMQRLLLGGGLVTGVVRVHTVLAMTERLKDTGNRDLALDALMIATSRGWWHNPDRESREMIVATAEGLGVAQDDPRLLAVLSQTAPLERGRGVLDRLSRIAPDQVAEPDALRLLGNSAVVVGASRLSAEFHNAAIRGLRLQGRLGLLAEALIGYAWAAWQLGQWSSAVASAEEAERLGATTNRHDIVAPARLARAVVAAGQGDAELATSIAGDVESMFLPLKAGGMLSLVQLVRGQAALGQNRPNDAYQALYRMFDPEDIAHSPMAHFAISQLADAAVEEDHRRAARLLMEELAHVTDQTRSPIALAGIVYARAVLADADAAEEHFGAALRHGFGDWPFMRARLLLAYGGWLRRHRRVSESRAPLRAALEACDALGAIPWAERARHELRASGERHHHRGSEARERLSAQELQIARLAGEGLSNREIGEQLYLSHRTVGSHLYRVYPKLGITSRAHLRAALASQALPS
jgi:DNA-binding CsgD family transcriptional regulator